MTADILKQQYEALKAKLHPDAKLLLEQWKDLQQQYSGDFLNTKCAAMLSGSQ